MNHKSDFSVIPNTYFFEFTFRSRRRGSPIAIDGKLDDWDPVHLVPDLMHTRGATPFANVYFSWDYGNLYLGVSVTGKRGPVVADTIRFWRGDCIEVWIDLRNDKRGRGYNEHCHHFFFLPKGRMGSGELATAGECSQPGSAIQETVYDHPDIEIASILGEGVYSLEARIPKSVIPTYDPVGHPIIGFNYHINDPGGRAQWWSCGPDFPRHIDPSTWGSVELIE